MSDPTAYHSELAEAMEQVAGGYDMSHGITAKSTRKDRVDHFAAVLASERVVDPADFDPVTHFSDAMETARAINAELREQMKRQSSVIGIARRDMKDAIETRNTTIERLEADVKTLISEAKEQCDKKHVALGRAERLGAQVTGAANFREQVIGVIHGYAARFSTGSNVRQKAAKQIEDAVRRIPLAVRRSTGEQT